MCMSRLYYDYFFLKSINENNVICCLFNRLSYGHFHNKLEQLKNKYLSKNKLCALFI